MLTPLLTLLVLTLLTGALLGWFTRRLHAADGLSVEQINALLPQTQCGQCGHPGCKPYAQAIANGAAINRCPPGGKTTIAALATLLGEKILPLDPTHGVESPRKVAFIREAECIGCTKCIQACPVDAILGSAKHMHTVIERECTGCDLCVEPCPVDCIDMLEAKTALPHPQSPLPAAAPAEQPCIRCGFCVDVCPAHLLPQQLYWFARSQQLDKAAAHNLHDCIECGACAWVCPSHIPLVTYYQEAKAGIAALADKQQRATLYQSRFDVHQLRIADEKSVEERRRAERAALLAGKQQQTTTTQSAQDIIAAALARVQAKKAAQQSQTPGDGNDKS